MLGTPPFSLTEGIFRFDISAAEKDLKYKPVIGYEEGWNDTIKWFRANWLPEFKEGSNRRLAGISKKTDDKIEIQAKGVADTKKRGKKQD